MALFRQDCRRLAFAAYSGIDDRYRDSPRRIEGQGLLEHFGRGLDVVRRHIVCEVDDAQPRLDAPHHALTHGDGAVLRAEVGEEENGRWLALLTLGCAREHPRERQDAKTESV